MRTDPVTHEEFTPTNPNHYFSSDISFTAYVDKLDPMETFTPVKRKINWRGRELKDPRNGKKFIAKHPAQLYAPD